MLIAAIGLAWAAPAAAQGCQFDMQCKGERICHMGMCMAPDADAAASAAGAGSGTEGATSARAPSTPASSNGSSRAAAAMAPPTMTTATHLAPQAAPRSCCTVAGRLRLPPPQSGDAPLVAGDACQGITNSGKPVPGTACN
ncbi:hypothetical protein [Cupriavidus agavae]|nr:hypothetical protein [Cupriavidus agavae]